jgi:hypothetical protein
MIVQLNYVLSFRWMAMYPPEEWQTYANPVLQQSVLQVMFTS